MKIIFLILFSYCIYPIHLAQATNGLFIQPRFGYQAPKSFQSSQVASYPGISYSGAAYYKISLNSSESLFDEGSKTYFAPVISYSYGAFSNSANTATITETLTDKTIAAGAKFYYDKIFIQAHYLWTSIENIARSTTSSLAINDNATGFGAAAGVEFQISPLISAELSGEINNVNFSPKTNGYSSKTQYLKFGGMLGISFLIPSGSSEKIQFKKPGQRN